jgi:hypothetical protein
MALDPFYFQHPPGSPPPTEEYKFRIIGYAKYQDYVLTTWRVDSNDGKNPRFPDRPGHVDGQTLWRIKHHLISRPGKLLLYQKEPPLEVGQRTFPKHPIKGRLNPALGRYGLPPTVAIALQDPANYVVIEP